MTTSSPKPADRTGWLRAHWTQLALAALLLIGLGLRLIDLTDPPLDFHPTRQYRGALIARSLYYQWSPSEDSELQSIAVGARDQVAELEPPFLESLVAAGYLLAGREQLWIARIITSLAWLLGGWALFGLVSRAVAPLPGLLTLAFYLVLPFAVVASRSFQPDPLMVAALSLAAYSAYRWAEERTWRWALWTGVSTGLAILIKASAALFAGPMIMALILSRLGLRSAWRERQIWVMAALSLLPAAIFYLFISEGAGGFAQQAASAIPLAADPTLYVRWLSFIARFLGLGTVVAALFGLALAQGSYRWLLAGLWLGYLVYGIAFPHHIITHDYYHLTAVLLLALSLAPFLAVLIGAIQQQGRSWRLFFGAILLAVFVYGAWVARSTLVAQDFEEEADFWTQVGKALPRDGETIGLVQYYGLPIAYYGWRSIDQWPISSNLQLGALADGTHSQEFDSDFDDRTAGKDFFLVTASSFLDAQPLLKERLGSYPLFREGDGYLIYDLRQ